ncbi:MAG: hypothetical protein ACFE9L_14465 [Candidatus Hodarchaeota archaeon]
MKHSQKISMVVLLTFISLLILNSHLDKFEISLQAFISNNSSEGYSIQWNTTFILRDIHTPHSLIQTSTGDYLVVGNRYPTPCGGGCCPFPQSDVFLMKVGGDGTIEQVDYYGDNAIDMDLGYVAIETEDGFTIAGRTNSPPVIEMDFMLLKQISTVT